MSGLDMIFDAMRRQFEKKCLKILERFVKAEQGLLDLSQLYLQSCVAHLIFELTYPAEERKLNPSAVSRRLSKFTKLLVAAVLLFGKEAGLDVRPTKSKILKSLGVKSAEMTPIVAKLTEKRQIIELNVLIGIGGIVYGNLKSLGLGEDVFSYVMAACMVYIEALVKEVYFRSKIPIGDLVAAALVHATRLGEAKDPCGLCKASIAVSPGIKEEEIIRKLHANAKTVDRIAAWMQENKGAIYVEAFIRA